MRTTALPTYAVEWGQAPIITQTSWLGEGDYCDCYLVNASEVFRFAKHAQASAALQVERCLLPILRDALPVAVPDVRFAGRRSDTGHALIGYPLLPGEPLERPVLEQLPPTSQDALLQQLAAFVRQLHALPLGHLRGCALPVSHPRTHLSAVMAQARTALRPRLTEVAWRYYADLWDRYTREPALHTYQPAVLHGDLSPDHILADTAQVQLTGVIDFGDACISDPAWDLVYIAEDYGPQILQAFLAHYDPPCALLLARKAQLYQQLNNLAYGLSLLAIGNDAQLHTALVLLEEQASTGGGG